VRTKGGAPVEQPDAGLELGRDVEDWFVRLDESLGQWAVHGEVPGYVAPPPPPSITKPLSGMSERLVKRSSDLPATVHIAA